MLQYNTIYGMKTKIRHQNKKILIICINQCNIISKLKNICDC